MATKRVLIVFVLPIVFSLIFGSVVMADILQKPDRELNMWPMSSDRSSSHQEKSLEILNLSSQYSVNEPVEIQVKVNDASFDCGDLYITIYSSSTNEVITQGGFLEQCFTNTNSLIPVNDKFSKPIDTPGSYKVVVDMVSKDLSNTSSSSEFNVK